MEKVYAEVGSSHQVVGGERPEGFIEMKSQRPGFANPALASGKWGAEPRDIPQSCTRRQGQLALIELGKYTEVLAYLEAIPDPKDKMIAEVEWQAAVWEVTNPFLKSLWAALGGTQESLEDAFILAVTL